MPAPTEVTNWPALIAALGCAAGAVAVCIVMSRIVTSGIKAMADAAAVQAAATTAQAAATTKQADAMQALTSAVNQNSTITARLADKIDALKT